jgi:hypothetical protein
VGGAGRFILPGRKNIAIFFKTNSLTFDGLAQGCHMYCQKFYSVETFSIFSAAGVKKHYS